MVALRRPDLLADEGYENKPESDGGRPRLKEEGESCWKCSTPVVKQEPRKKRPDRGYYFEYYLWCPTCQATYEVEEAKRFIDAPPSLF